MKKRTVTAEDVNALYSTVDKSKKTRRHIGRGDWEEISTSLRATEELQPPPLPPRPPVDQSESQRASGVYEEVEDHCGLPVFDSSGYTEVRGERDFSQGLEVGFSGSGSISKLRSVLGPEFSQMTGKDARGPVYPLPAGGRRAVEVVLLNGKRVEFAVWESAVASQLFELVVSSQSLEETHFFGLAVRMGQSRLNLLHIIES